MQVSAIFNSEQLFNVKLGDAVITMRYLPKDQLRKTWERATVTTFDKNHNKSTTADPAEQDRLLGRAVVVGWSGIKIGDDELAFTPENLDAMMTRHVGFSRFINDMAIDLDALVREEQEAERKNF